MNGKIPSRGKALPGVLLALLILLSCALALGEPGPGQRDCGDFILTFPAGSHLQEGAGQEGQPLFTLFPDYDASSFPHANLNCVRSAEVRDFSGLSNDQMVSLAEAGLAPILAGLEAQKLIVENMKVVSVGLTSLSGKTAFACTYSMDVDYLNLERDTKLTVFSRQYFLSDPSFKTYAFTLTAPDVAGINKLENILRECVVFK